ncbi:hypothetical protein HDU80_000430, partial [Chytriomyces hyalinus]
QERERQIQSVDGMNQRAADELRLRKRRRRSIATEESDPSLDVISSGASNVDAERTRPDVEMGTPEVEMAGVGAGDIDSNRVAINSVGRSSAKKGRSNAEYSGSSRRKTPFKVILSATRNSNSVNLSELSTCHSSSATPSNALSTLSLMPSNPDSESESDHDQCPPSPTLRKSQSHLNSKPNTPAGSYSTGDRFIFVCDESAKFKFQVANSKHFDTFATGAPSIASTITGQPASDSQREFSVTVHAGMMWTELTGLPPSAMPLPPNASPLTRQLIQDPSTISTSTSSNSIAAHLSATPTKPSSSNHPTNRTPTASSTTDSPSGLFAQDPAGVLVSATRPPQMGSPNVTRNREFLTERRTPVFSGGGSGRGRNINMVITPSGHRGTGFGTPGPGGDAVSATGSRNNSNSSLGRVRAGGMYSGNASRTKLTFSPCSGPRAETQKFVNRVVKLTPRNIARSPYKVLDAPELQDDFYLNLVDWSSSNILGVGLGSCVYLWNAQSSKVTKLCDMARTATTNGVGNTVTSVNWNPKGTMVAIGTHRGVVEIWDVEKEKKIRDLAGHDARVGSIAWSGDTLATGSRDRSILLRDTRTPAGTSHSFAHVSQKLTGHRQEVCGLKWSPEETLLASGGNDNKLLIWDRRGGSAGGVRSNGGENCVEPLHSFREHQAAVKAIAWSPHQSGLIASGGGTADQKIRFWNTTTGSALSVHNTQSQVCNLAWSLAGNEIVSTHGFSQNQVVVWKVEVGHGNAGIAGGSFNGGIGGVNGSFGGVGGIGSVQTPGLTQMATLTGHTMRVLYLAVSPDNQNIVTGAGDETLRFWSVFGKASKSRPDSDLGAGGLILR